MEDFSVVLWDSLIPVTIHSFVLPTIFMRWCLLYFMLQVDAMMEAFTAISVFVSTHYFVLSTFHTKLSRARSPSGTVNKFIALLSPSDEVILSLSHTIIIHLVSLLCLSDKPICFGAFHAKNSSCFFLNFHLFFYTGTSHKNIYKCFHRYSHTPPQPLTFRPAFV